ncbi:hypothetical protein [Tenacibaculum mesophilum]|uniref:hypothetical protein n=1 Tax=Tenacibaculum mesophilum TaxID=104268 RepID=UPI003F5DA9D7
MTLKRNIPEDIKETNIRVLKRIKPTIEPSWLGHTKDCCIIDNELIVGATKEELTLRSGREESGVLGHISHLKKEHGLIISKNNGIYRFEYMRPKLKKAFTVDELSKLLEEEIEEVAENCIVKLEDSNRKESWYSINIDAPSYNGENIRPLSISSNFSKALLGKKINDSINFGNGFRIISIRKYMSF